MAAPRFLDTSTSSGTITAPIWRDAAMKGGFMRWMAVLFLVIAACWTAQAAAQGSRPRTYCQCVEACAARSARCLKAFDEDCGKVPQPANCEPRFRTRCEQGAGLCNLDCGTAFRATACKPGGKL